jgi:hypothetical protein
MPKLRRPVAPQLHAKRDHGGRYPPSPESRVLGSRLSLYSSSRHRHEVSRILGKQAPFYFREGATNGTRLSTTQKTNSSFIT